MIDFAVPIFGDEEKEAVNKVLDGVWLASGEQNVLFEKEFAEYIGVDYAVCVNSGSSANLLALAALDLPKGSKVLTSACGFPATLAPILHLGFEPVLVDYDIKTHNIDIQQINEASGVDAIIAADTMGIPVDIKNIELDVPIISDCCESLGGIYKGAQVGAYADLATYSFYPSHQITALGGGGMVTTNDPELYKRLISLRDWGKIYRDNTGYLGRNDTCYNVDVDGVDYFAHYAYEYAGYNMKLPEANAAFGRVQLKRLSGFSNKRFNNWNSLSRVIKTDLPRIPERTRPSFFGFTILSDDRDKLGNHLEAHDIKHRPFFAGNITRHNPFKEYAGNFPVADYLMKNALFIGCHPQMTSQQIDHIKYVINSFNPTDHHPV